MADRLLEALLAARNPHEKSAIIAESIFDDLAQTTRTVAQRCVLLHWFTQPILAALATDLLPEAATVAPRLLAEISPLPFVEGKSAGEDTSTAQQRFAYHDQTRQGLLARYRQSQPDLLRTAARLAAPVYASLPGNERQEALFCWVVAGETQQAGELLDEQVEELASQNNWMGLLALFALCEEANALALGVPLDFSPLHYFARALAAHELGDLVAAIADYDQAILLNPADATAYNNRGIARKAQGDLVAAIADYDQAILLNPAYADAYHNRGIARKAQGDLVAAIADYDQAILLLPDGENKATAYNNRGTARKAQGDLVAAIADYDQAILLNPAYATAYNNKAILLRRLQRWDEAKVAYQQLVRLEAARWDSWLGLADVARHLGDEAGWQQALAQAQALFADDDLYNRACLESIAGNHEAAFTLLAQAEAQGQLDTIWAQQDPDLAWLRHDPRFAEIVK